MSAKSDKKSTPPEPVCILLPICEELNDDLFLSVLKNTIARTKFGEKDDMEYALKTGMAGEDFSIETEDLTGDWKVLTTKEQKIRQAKLLGFWASYNFPSMGKTLFGATWEPTQKSGVDVIGHPIMDADLINSAIFKKMRLRVMELTVMPSTITKIKWFVKIPNSISNKHTAYRVSPKIKSFDIVNEYINDCWNALKIGSFVMEVGSNLTPKQSNNSAVIHDDINAVGHRVSIDETDYSTTTPLTLNLEARESSIRQSSNANSLATNENTSNLSLISPAKRARLDDSSYNETLKMAVEEIRQHVTNLTTWFDPTTVAPSHFRNGPEHLHLIVFKQKDDEINQLKTSLQSLQKEHDCLTTDHANLSADMGKQLDLTIALQKGIDASAKLNEKSERDLAISLNLIHELKAEVDTATETSKKQDEMELNFRTQIDDLTMKLADASKLIQENEILKGELAVMKEQSADMGFQFRTEIETLDGTLKERDSMYSVMVDANSKMQEELIILRKEKEQSNDYCQSIASEFALEPLSERTKENEQGTDIEADMPTTSSLQKLISEPDELIREQLLQCRFGWLKFYKTKNTKYPGFAHPPNGDGILRAQKVTSSGSVGDIRTYLEFSENIPESKKEKAQVAALKKLNKKFNFSFV